MLWANSGPIPSGCLCLSSQALKIPVPVRFLSFNPPIHCSGSFPLSPVQDKTLPHAPAFIDDFPLPPPTNSSPILPAWPTLAPLFQHVLSVSCFPGWLTVASWLYCVFPGPTGHPFPSGQSYSLSCSSAVSLKTVTASGGFSVSSSTPLCLHFHSGLGYLVPEA